jgi:hypothetical protein
MTGLAVSAFLRSVHMQIMQVSVPVPEARGKGGIGKTEQVPVMTGKAQDIFLIAVRHVKIGRELVREEFLIGRPMRVMARRALSVPDRTMKNCHILFDEIFVAVQAEIFTLFRQKLLIIASMGRMA